MKTKMLAIILLAAIFSFCPPAYAAFDDLAGTKPAVLLCEVKSYGAENGHLRSEFLKGLEGRILENLQSSKNLGVAFKKLQGGENYEDDFSRFHQMLIIESGHYETSNGDACADLIRFAKNYGDPTTEILSKELIRLEGGWLESIRRVAADHAAQYLAFVNVRHAHSDIKFVGIGKGDKIETAIDYYFVNPQNGKTFHRRYKTSKRAYIADLEIVVYGKKVNVEGILAGSIEVNAEKICRDLNADGLKAVI